MLFVANFEEIETNVSVPDNPTKKGRIKMSKKTVRDIELAGKKVFVR